MAFASLRLPSRLVRFVPTVGLPLALAGAAACGVSPDPTAAAVLDGAVEVVEDGAGDTTVVFESGLDSDWTPWQPVASEVAAQARTFAYSRPGYGQSE